MWHEIAILSVAIVLCLSYGVVELRSSAASENQQKSRLCIFGEIAGNTFVIVLGCVGLTILVYQLQDALMFQTSIINNLYGGDQWAYYFDDGHRYVRMYAENPDAWWIKATGLTLFIMGGFKAVSLITRPACTVYNQWARSTS